MKRSSQIMILLLAVVLFAAFAVAAEQKITLQAGPGGKGASGEAAIKDSEMTLRGEPQKDISISASGLQPNSVYTVWFVNEKPKMEMEGVGKADYSFKSDDKGNGSYTAAVPASEVNKWSLLEVALHPDGNPKNMDNIQIALKGSLRQQG